MTRPPGTHGDGPGVVPIQSVERAARLLALFTPAEPELTLSDIVERLGMSRPTVHRYGMSLRTTGLLRYDAARGTYSLGARVIELGRTALATVSIVKVAGRHMERLSEEINETVVLSIWDGSAPIIVEVVDRTDRLVSMSIRQGSRLPISSAQGRAFLAFSAVARSAHEGDPQVEALDAELQVVRRAGYAISDGVIPGIAVAAAPVMERGEVAGTIALICHQVSGIASPDHPAMPVLMRTAEAIGQDLGQIG